MKNQIIFEIPEGQPKRSTLKTFKRKLLIWTTKVSELFAMWFWARCLTVTSFSFPGFKSEVKGSVPGVY